MLCFEIECLEILCRPILFNACMEMHLPSRILIHIGIIGKLDNKRKVVFTISNYFFFSPSCLLFNQTHGLSFLHMTLLGIY